MHMVGPFPLLEFVFVRIALRDGLRSGEQVGNYVAISILTSLDFGLTDSE